MAQISNIYHKERVPLWTVIPLDTPFVIEVEPVSYCNIKCKYCLHSLPKKEILDSGHKFEYMSDELFNLMLKQVNEFPNRIKQIGFAGMGEPLLHKKLPFMIEKLKKYAGIQRITITTNGIALSHQLTDDLINAGLDHIKISVNGISEEDFRKNCAAEVDFDKYLEQIDYFYHHKGGAEIACKTMDTCIGENENVFYEMFKNICDTMSIEKTIKVFHEVSYDNMISDDNKVLSRYDMRNKEVRICASPFFRFAVKADGQVSTCRLYNGLTCPDFNIKNRSLLDIWNSEERHNMLLGVLKEKNDGLNAYCKDCTLRDDFAFESDLLDDHAEDLYNKLIRTWEERNL
ncbi:radical SAM protein [Lacrimispora xylanisolvens]|uniref:radical SAM protein n=1 Tax=Lacrimispora xylanisolvens TaxID=384636 RepID=UPI0024029FF8|nr:radical SAM protein [Paenibacillaceae bacterium]